MSNEYDSESGHLYFGIIEGIGECFFKTSSWIEPGGRRELSVSFITIIRIEEDGILLQPWFPPVMNPAVTQNSFMIRRETLTIWSPASKEANDAVQEAWTPRTESVIQKATKVPPAMKANDIMRKLGGR